MAAATYPYFQTSGRFSPALKTAAGWIGSKAGTRRDFCKVDANGFIDQAAAAGAVVATVRIGVLQNDVASGVAAASDDALDVQYCTLGEETYVTLPLITSGSSFTTFVSATAANVGDLVGLARRTAGDYCWDTTGTDYGKVLRVDVARGLVTCSVLATVRLP